MSPPYASALFLTPPPTGAFVTSLVPGAHGIAFGEPGLGLRLRAWGLELRDTVLVLSPGPRTETAYLFRVPLSEDTVAGNVLKHGTGAININAGRVFTDWNEPDRGEAWKRSGHSAKPDAAKLAAPPGQGITLHPEGRFPPNVLLVHSKDCKRLGTREVVSDGRHPAKRGKAGVWSGEGGGLNGTSGEERFFGKDGKETVADWACTEGCPSRLLNEQAGHLRGSGQTHIVRKGPRTTQAYRTQTAGDNSVWQPHDNGGTASRFFPQFAGPLEMQLWLEHLITPDTGTCLREAV